MLKLSPLTFETIRKHAEEAYPDECCGVLLGKATADERRILDILSIENAFDEGEKHHRFLITPEHYRDAEASAQKRELDILGFYHSHPNVPSVPSKYDLEHAFPWFSYLILSVTNGQYIDHHSWIMKDDRSSFKEEIVVIV